MVSDIWLTFNKGLFPYFEAFLNIMEEGWPSYLFLSQSSTILKVNSFLSDWPLFSTQRHRLVLTSVGDFVVWRNVLVESSWDKVWLMPLFYMWCLIGRYYMEIVPNLEILFVPKVCWNLELEACLFVCFSKLCYK